ncbi:MAG: hypothetical protein ABJA37_12920 [Ferruginibacter sp.]
MGKYIFSLFFGLLALQPLVPNHAATMSNTNIAGATPVLLTWDMLFKVILVEKYSPKYKMKINVPEFDYTLQQMNHKEVVIEGFAIPTGILSTTFVLSKNPYAACYFCGNGGIETVMTIKYFGIAPKFKTDDYIKVKGIFELNSTDVNELIYVLKNATVIK